MPETIETYISFQEYLESQPGAVILFTLHDFRGTEFDRQVVPASKVGITARGTLTAKFVVDELLAAKLVPGNYKLYLYVGLPMQSALAEKKVLLPVDYTLNKCLTEQGIQIRVRGGINGTSVTGVPR